MLIRYSAGAQLQSHSSGQSYRIMNNMKSSESLPINCYVNGGENNGNVLIAFLTSVIKIVFTF